MSINAHSACAQTAFLGIELFEVVAVASKRTNVYSPLQTRTTSQCSRREHATFWKQYAPFLYVFSPSFCRQATDKSTP